MAYKMTFKRCEVKFIITEAQKRKLLSLMSEYMTPDIYGKSTIRNIYFDTPDFRIARASAMKPTYKEKLRLRSYKTVNEEDTVFLELKKKFEGYTYKRREAMTEREAATHMMLGIGGPDTQVMREIDSFCSFYPGIHPTAFIAYDREAFTALDGSDLRITFDDNVIARASDLTLTKAPYGTLLLERGKHILEIKTAYAMPLWLTKFLSSEKIYKGSFSKYGTAYKIGLLGKKEITRNGEKIYA